MPRHAPSSRPLVMPPPRPADDARPGVTAGGYLVLRRQALGLTLREVAEVYARSRESVPACHALLHDAEADRHPLNRSSLDRLRLAYPFDAEIYLDLVDGAPVRSICLGCGCSWLDACVDLGHPGPCAWTDRTERRCTSCATKARDDAA